MYNKRCTCASHEIDFDVKWCYLNRIHMATRQSFPSLHSFPIDKVRYDLIGNHRCPGIMTDAKWSLQASLLQNDSGLQQLICLFQLVSVRATIHQRYDSLVPLWAGTIKLDEWGRSAIQGLPYEPFFPSSPSSLVPFNGHLIWLTNLQGI